VSLSGIAETAISGSSLNDQELVLTFDRAPSKTTEEIGAYLNSRSIGGTFFVEGQKLSDKTILSALRESGHLIGNGTLSHASLTKTPALLTEIRKVDQIITPYVVGNMFLFRAPGGAFNKETAEYLNRQGLQKYVGPIGWDVSLDPLDVSIALNCSDESISVGACSTNLFEVIAEKKRGILRFSSTQKDLPLLLKELIPNLEAAKFKFRRLDQVPDVRRELVKREARLDASGEEGGCDDYSAS
jgi:peptidoglycan/xylan/chitin deacetylase (PgdA/CDA1 family)